MEHIKFNIGVLRATRTNVLATIDKFSYEQLTTIPVGFSNSILWNFTHSIVSQQLLIYALSSNKMHLDESLISKFRKGTNGTETISNSEFEELKKDYLTTVDQLEQDVEMLLNSEYNNYKTSYNVELKSVSDAITFSNAHEALHFGVIMAISK